MSVSSVLGGLAFVLECTTSGMEDLIHERNQSRSVKRQIQQTLEATRALTRLTASTAELATMAEERMKKSAAGAGCALPETKPVVAKVTPPTKAPPEASTEEEFLHAIFALQADDPIEEIERDKCILASERLITDCKKMGKESLDAAIALVKGLPASMKEQYLVEMITVLAEKKEYPIETLEELASQITHCRLRDKAFQVIERVKEERNEEFLADIYSLVETELAKRADVVAETIKARRKKTCIAHSERFRADCEDMAQLYLCNHILRRLLQLDEGTQKDEYLFTMASVLEERGDHALAEAVAEKILNPCLKKALALITSKKA